jgi:hypothetical protein
MLSNAANFSSRKTCPLRFVRFVLFSKTDRVSSETKVDVPWITEVLATVRIKYLVSDFVIHAEKTSVNSLLIVFSCVIGRNRAI